MKRPWPLFEPNENQGFPPGMTLVSLPFETFPFRFKKFSQPQQIELSVLWNAPDLLKASLGFLKFTFRIISRETFRIRNRVPRVQISINETFSFIENAPDLLASSLGFFKFGFARISREHCSDSKSGSPSSDFNKWNF